MHSPAAEKLGSTWRSQLHFDDAIDASASFLAQDELRGKETLLFIIKHLTQTCPNYSLQIIVVQTKTLPPHLLRISISCLIFLTKQSNAIATFKCQIYLQIGSNLTTLNEMQSYLTVKCDHVSFVALCLLCLKNLS